MDLFEYVLDKDATRLYPTLLGMYYLNLLNPINEQEYNYLLGVVENNIGKKTIISSIVYLDEYFIFNNQKEPLTYISTIEVNSFFRNQGVYKKTCEILFNFINFKQHILISQQSKIGEKCKVYETLKKIAVKKGFEKYILEDNYHLSDSKFYEMICLKQKENKILEKVKK